MEDLKADLNWTEAGIATNRHEIVRNFKDLSKVEEKIGKYFGC